MAIQLTIRNDESSTTAARLQVAVVTVGPDGATDQTQALAGGESITVTVGPGQFLQIDEQEH